MFIHRRLNDNGTKLPPYRFNLLPSDNEEYNGEDMLSDGDDDDDEEEDEYGGSSSDAYADEEFEEDESRDEDDVEEDSTNGMYLQNSVASGPESAEELQVETAAKRERINYVT